ncbi:MAG TPA: DUF5335 family protein [Acidimicrobiales bacterium]|jgi:hypothetical protein|nr:DUF5335 family protein [Acidimicrobiales bacterium]
MAQATEELPKSGWKDALELLTKEHEGDVVTIEVISLELGDQSEAEKLPLAYVEYDPHDDAASVGVGGRDGRFPVVLRHVIEQPRRIAVASAATEGSTAIEVEDPDGITTLITLHPLAALGA